MLPIRILVLLGTAAIALTITIVPNYMMFKPWEQIAAFYGLIQVIATVGHEAWQNYASRKDKIS